MSWHEAPLGDLIDVLSGFAFKSSKFNSDGDGLPLVRIRDVVPGHTSTYFDGSFDERYLVRDRDILIGMDGEFNRARWKGGEALLNQRVCKVTPKNGKLHEPYLFYVLPRVLKEIEDKTPFVTVKHLSAKGLKEAEIPLPPLEEQTRIAAILDQADALRRLRQRAIDQLNILGQAIFHEMFGDPKTNPKGFPWTELGNTADFYSGNTLPEGEPFSDQIDGHLILKVSDLNHTRNQQDVVCAASWSASPGSRAGTCPPDALVFPKRGGAIGTNKKRWLKRSAILDPNLMGVRPDGKELTMSFLNGWFQTFNLSDIASGSSVPQLNKKDLAPLKVALPPIAEQLEYSRRIDTLSMVRDGALGAALHEEELFKVLQYRAFRGEL